MSSSSSSSFGGMAGARPTLPSSSSSSFLSRALPCVQALETHLSSSNQTNHGGLDLNTASSPFAAVASVFSDATSRMTHLSANDRLSLVDNGKALFDLSNRYRTRCSREGFSRIRQFAANFVSLGYQGKQHPFSTTEYVLLIKINFNAGISLQEAAQHAQATEYLNNAIEMWRSAAAGKGDSFERTYADLGCSLFAAASEAQWRVGQGDEAISIARVQSALVAHEKAKHEAFALAMTCYNRGVELYSASTSTTTATAAAMPVAAKEGGVSTAATQSSSAWLRLSSEVMELPVCQAHREYRAKQARNYRVLALALQTSDPNEALSAADMSLGFGVSEDTLFVKGSLLLTMNGKMDDAKQVLHTLCTMHANSTSSSPSLLSMCLELLSRLAAAAELDAALSMLTTLGTSAHLTNDERHNLCVLHLQLLCGGGSSSPQNKSIAAFLNAQQQPQLRAKLFPVLWNKAVDGFQKSQFKEALAWVEHAGGLLAENDTSDRQITCCRARSMCLYGMGDFPMALAAAEHALRLAPTADSQLHQLRALLRLGAVEKASQAMAALLRYSDVQADMLQVISREAMEAGDTAVTIQALASLLDHFASHKQVPTIAVMQNLLHLRTVSLADLSTAADKEQALQIIAREAERVPAMLANFEDRDIVEWFASALFNLGIGAPEACTTTTTLFRVSAVLFTRIASLPGSSDDTAKLAMNAATMAATSMLENGWLTEDAAERAQLGKSALEFLRQSQALAVRLHQADRHGLNDLLRFQAKLFQADTNLSRELEACAKSPGMTGEFLETMAMMCMEGHYHRLPEAVLATKLALQHHLMPQVLTVPWDAVSRLYRMLLHYLDGAERKLAVYNELKEIVLARGDVDCYPQEEAKWVVASAWNTACLTFKQGDVQSTEKLMTTAIQLCRVVNKGEGEDWMKEQYAKVLATM